MGFAKDSGYTPTNISTIMLSIMNNYNFQFGTNYTPETFIATNAYKYWYALSQRMQENETKTSEIFLQLQQYFTLTNERISRPVVTNPGIVEILSDNDYVASVKPPILADAGLLHVCVDADDGDHAVGTFTITSYANLVSGSHDTVTVGATVFTAQGTSVTPGGATFQAASSNSATALSLASQINAHATASTLVRAQAIAAVVHMTAIQGGTGGNAIALAYTDNDTNVGATKSGTFLAGGATNADYAATRLAIATIIKDSSVAGIVTVGSESETIVLTNGQSFDFKFNLPNRNQILLRLTTVLSENNQTVIKTPEEIKDILLTNIAARYGLGKDFEPQRYFSTVDAPWAGSILLEWSNDAGASYQSTVFDAEYDDLFECLLGNVTLVES